MILLIFYIFLLTFYIVQIAMTASTLLEAAEPSILWKHLLKGILNAINSSEHQLEVFQRGALSLFH